MQALVAVIIAFVFGVLERYRRRRRFSRLPARALIISPPRSTELGGDGGVRSVQSARLTLSAADLDRLWTPVNLENLGRTYWRFLTKVTLHLVNVVYTERERSVVLLRWIRLLRFAAPEYELEPLHGRITWEIKDGLLVSRTGRSSGWLSLDVRREPPPENSNESVDLTIEVEVANFYPSIASGLSRFVYEVTQAFVHALVTHAFLRSLATLELAESKVRRFRIEHSMPRSGDQP